MSWLTNYVLPKIRALTRKDVPDNLWRKCPSCEQMLFHRDLAQSLDVCHHCGHHFRIGSEARFKMLFDDGVFEKVEAPKVQPDPLRFRDRKRYTERLREGQAALGAGSDAVAIAQGRIGGQPAVVPAFDFAFMGGSMGVAAGEGMLSRARRAVERQAALIAVPASGGARMQEGILSLMQMPRTILAADMVKEAGLPYIVILTDPTTGGVAASFASIGDITLAEPGAIIGFAGARVIEETIREKLPEGFQRAEYLHAHGNPQDRLPPAVHIAGTNGKGSTLATLRACFETAGYRVHAYTSPHLVRFHERIRLAGELIDEDALLALLEECERANGGEPITFFEITTAAAFLAFARIPADVVLLETGLGGRLDATNVIPGPATTAITPVSLDHQAFLGDTIAAIAGEKPGILKPRLPAILGLQPEKAETVIEARAAAIGAPVFRWHGEWHCEPRGEGMRYVGTRWRLDLPLPSLPG